MRSHFTKLVSHFLLPWSYYNPTAPMASHYHVGTHRPAGPRGQAASRVVRDIIGGGTKSARGFPLALPRAPKAPCADWCSSTLLITLPTSPTSRPPCRPSLSPPTTLARGHHAPRTNSVARRTLRRGSSRKCPEPRVSERAIQQRLGTIPAPRRTSVRSFTNIISAAEEQVRQ